ncbi:hypothetical protein [Pseudomonas sp. VI4.1]|uniref:hypothetical protein n=1 Tax=Pseudomonas sp. VI4.1 TaxID=1941346 RepID=UPI003532785D
MATSPAASAFDTAVYRIDSEGRHELPTIELKWWDASSGQTRMAQVPAVTFDAVANSAYQPVFSITEYLTTSAGKVGCTFPGIGWGSRRCSWA